MDHPAMEDSQLADRYVLRKLPEAERVEFEEHFLDCPACLDTLERAEGLRRALKEVPSGFSAWIPVSPAPSASSDRFAPRRARPLLILLAASVIAAIAASLLFYGEARQARRELEAVRQGSEGARQRQVELEQAPQKERAVVSRPSDAATAALDALPLAASVFTLNLTRGASSEAGDRVVLPRSRGWIVLLFDPPDDAETRKYRVRISTAEGHPVGSPVTATAASGGMLAVTLPSSLLASGDYGLTVEDATSGHLLATYRFRAIPKS